MSDVRAIYGVQPVLEALRTGRVQQILVAREAGAKTKRIEELAQQEGVRVIKVSRKELSQRAKVDNHQGVLAEMGSGAEEVDLDTILDRAEAAGEEPLVLLLDGIQDPQNLGAILRSAHAMGAHGVVIPKNRAVGITPAVIRASAGAALHLPVARVVNLKHALERLEARQIWTAAAVMDGDPAFRARLDGPLGLVIGGEGEGVRRSLAERCDMRVSVPLANNFDSLNASVAAGILLYETVRQRLDKPRNRP